MKITYRTLLTMVVANEQPKKLKVGTATYTWNGCDYVLTTDSRRSLTDTLTSWTTKAQTTAEFIEVVEELLTIECAPTVEAEPKWISVSERLPSESDDYLVTIEFGTGTFDTELFYFNAEKTRWLVEERYGEDFFVKNKIIAWMELPAPYEVRE